MMYPEVRYFYCLGCDPKQPQYTNNGTIAICKSFLTKMWSDPTFDECGVMQSNECPTSWGDNDMDPYMCGDDLILPKTQFPGPTGALDFIKAYKPPGLDDFDFEEYDDA